MEIDSPVSGTIAQDALDGSRPKEKELNITNPCIRYPNAIFLLFKLPNDTQ